MDVGYVVELTEWGNGRMEEWVIKRLWVLDDG